jgi:hypothetical protein
MPTTILLTPVDREGVLIAPTALRADLDAYGRPLTPGCRVRVFDSGRMSEDGRLLDHDTTGPRTDYVEGRLISIGEVFNADHRCYAVAGDRIVGPAGGRVHRQSYHPPVNGTPTTLGRYTCAVIRLVVPLTRCATAKEATTAVRERADTYLYEHDPEIRGDQNRAASHLRADLETAFGFLGSPTIPEPILAKAFDIARRISFERCGRFVPRALVEDYADLAEILNLAAETPIRF